MLLPQTLQNRKPFLASKTTFSRKKSTNHEVSQTRLYKPLAPALWLER
jgi:hypothetical protein